MVNCAHKRLWQLYWRPVMWIWTFCLCLCRYAHVSSCELSIHLCVWWEGSLSDSYFLIFSEEQAESGTKKPYPVHWSLRAGSLLLPARPPLCDSSFRIRASHRATFFGRFISGMELNGHQVCWEVKMEKRAIFPCLYIEFCLNEQ